jgi:hypothetical protein
VGQIIPADPPPGHRAVFIRGATAAVEPVICWALCETDGDGTRTPIVPVVAYDDPFLTELRVITDDTYDFWYMLKPGEEPPSVEEARGEVAERGRDMELRAV